MTETLPPPGLEHVCDLAVTIAAPQWAWVNESQFIGSGRRAPDGVFLSFYRVV